MEISLCMITKDEEHFLPQCLDSVKGVVDEIIIVDTGSSDRTCEIALSFGAMIYHHSWQNNFSEARNFGIDRAKGAWILVLDADETLDDGELIRELAEKAEEDVKGFLFALFNYSDEAKTQVEKSVNIRLFRNKPEFRFSGAIHEQLPLQEKFVAMTDLVIHHWGYMPSVTTAKNKSKRNLGILQQEVIKEPENPFVHFNLGTEYIGLQQYEQAIAHFFEALKFLKEETGYVSRLYKLLILCFLQLEPRDEFKTMINQGIKKYPDYPDLYYMRGLYLKKVGEFSRAIMDFMRCLVMDQCPFADKKVYVTEEGLTNYKAFYELGRVFDKLGKREEALTAYARSLQGNPLYPDVMEKMKKWFTKRGEWLSFFEQRVFGEHENPQERLTYAQHFLSEGDVTLAFSLLENLIDKNYLDQVNYIRGIGHFLTHDFEQATKRLAKIPKAHSLHLKAAPYLAASLWITEQTEKAKRALLGSDSPGPCLLKSVELLLHERKRKIHEGKQKYSLSESLKKVFTDESTP